MGKVTHQSNHLECQQLLTNVMLWVTAHVLVSSTECPFGDDSTYYEVYVDLRQPLYDPMPEVTVHRNAISEAGL